MNRLINGQLSGFSMISMKYLMLVMLLAVRRCFSSAPLSLIQRQIEDVYYFGTAMPPKIIPLYNSKMNTNIQLLMMDNCRTVTFTAVIRGTISCLNWFLDDLDQNNPVDLSTYLETFEILRIRAIESNSKVYERALTNLI